MFKSPDLRFQPNLSAAGWGGDSVDALRSLRFLRSLRLILGRLCRVCDLRIHG